MVNIKNIFIKNSQIACQKKNHDKNTNMLYSKIIIINRLGFKILYW